MVSVDEELKAAKTAKAVIDQLLTPAIPTKIALWRTLRTAKDAAVLNLGGGGGPALNDARAKAGIALSNVMDGPERVDNAKSAIDDWIKELEAAKAA
jgi:hypothetical protein